MLTGELKKELIDVLIPIVEGIQKRRTTVTDADVTAFMQPRPLSQVVKSNQTVSPDQ